MNIVKLKGHTTAQDVALDLLRSSEFLGMGLRKVALEESLADHLLELRLGLGVAKKLFREEND